MIGTTIIRFIYYPQNRKKKYVITFYIFNTIVFFISSLLRDVELSIGFGFSLLGILSVLRYRTEAIPIKEMAYLFTVMSLPFMNALFVSKTNLIELVFINLIVVVILYAVEKEWGLYYEENKTIEYEKIELIKPNNYTLLLEDLRERTGLDVKRCEVGRIDFLRDTAELKIYYDALEKQA